MISQEDKTGKEQTVQRASWSLDKSNYIFPRSGIRRCFVIRSQISSSTTSPYRAIYLFPVQIFYHSPPPFSYSKNFTTINPLSIQFHKTVLLLDFLLSILLVLLLSPPTQPPRINLRYLITQNLDNINRNVISQSQHIFYNVPRRSSYIPFPLTQPNH